MEKKTIKFVCISDTHGLTDELEVPEGDVLIHAGDFSNTGEPNIVEDFNEFLKKLKHPYKIVIAGNHDLTFDVENYKNKFRKRVNFLFLSGNFSFTIGVIQLIPKKLKPF
jgi:3',5'-cyclic AMP phosphodiesterase CpdA